MLTCLGYIDGIHGTPYIAAPWIQWDTVSFIKFQHYYSFILVKSRCINIKPLHLSSQFSYSLQKSLVCSNFFGFGCFPSRFFKAFSKGKSPFLLIKFYFHWLNRQVLLSNRSCLSIFGMIPPQQIPLLWRDHAKHAQKKSAESITVKLSG